MRDELRELWKYRELLRQLVARELKVRYKNSALGFLWSIAPPLMQVFVFSFLVRDVFNVRAANYSAYLLCGLIPWTFFSTGVLDASQSILLYYPVIGKVYLPREVVPLAVALSNFVHFLLGWCVFFAAFFVAQPVFAYFVDGVDPVPVLFPRILLFPVLLLFSLLLVVGVSLWASALNVFFEDVKFILQSLFSVVIFVLPVLFTADVVGQMPVMRENPWLFQLYMVNPVTALITAFRGVLLEPLPPNTFNDRLPPGLAPDPLAAHGPTLAAACLLCVLLAWGGYAFFNRRKWQFVERG